MSHEKLRRQIAVEAARLIYQSRESDVHRAKISAARALYRGWVKPRDLPSDAEIRDELQRMAWLVDGGSLSESFYPSATVDPEAERFQRYRLLLIPLAQVEQKRNRHPEGDALYHSLQVFELARNESAWDEEFLLAALLHDVGKGIDPLDHVAAGLSALEGFITDRTIWLIENHSDAQRLHEGTLGGRARRRLSEHPDYEWLLSLARCDREGRVPGAEVPEIDEALACIRDVAALCED
jgi:hypothetical protein